ncbi:MAG TPA: T9SS type A sorting domain-containing protein, partial [Candidatus Eisenbacteria bacterium]
VRTNLKNNIRETTLENNLESSTAPFLVDIPELVLDVPATITLSPGDSRYYRLASPAGFDLSVTVNSDDADATNELYMAFDRTPTPGDFDFTGPATFTARPSILVPSSQAGDYYLLVRAASLSSGFTAETVTIRARALPFSIASVSPGTIGSPGEVTITLNGAGFRPTTEISLAVAGGFEIPASRVRFINTTRLSARFQVPQGMLGPVLVVARNPGDNAETNLANALVIEPATAQAVVTTAVRQDGVRNNAPAYFTFRYRNVSNVDVAHFQARLILPGTAHIVAVQTSPDFLRRSTRYPELFQPTADDLIELPNTLKGESIQAIDLETAHLGPDAEVIVTLNVTNFPVTPFSILSLTELSDTPTWLGRQITKIESARQTLVANSSGVPAEVLSLAADPVAFRNQALEADHVPGGLLDSEDVGNLPGTVESIALAGLGDPFAGAAPPTTEEGVDCARPAKTPDCTLDGTPPACALPHCLACFQAPIPVTLRLGGGVTVSVQEPTCTPYTFEQCIGADVVAPCDPNTLTGPPGFGTDHWVGITQPLLFTANFENLSGVATAPAQVVQITLPLHANLDLSSFRLGSFGFGSHVIEVPPNRSSYTVEPYFSDLNLRVRVTAGVDVNNRQAFWTFTSIDPATGQLPSNPQVGFLPVNDTFGRGQGFCNFTVKPFAGAGTGAPIAMQASVKFDTNVPVLTNTTGHKVDAGRPVSSLAGAPQAVNASTVRVNWNGSDGASGSGVATYDLYMQQNGGTFQFVTGGITGNTATLALTPGKSYGFYTIALDNSGNPESAKNTADGTISLGSGTGVPDASVPPAFQLAQNYPNPFRSATTIEFDLPVEAPARLRVYDVAGRLVATYLDGRPMPAGRHTLNVEAGSFGNGVYFYHLEAGGKVFTRKMLVLR